MRIGFDVDGVIYDWHMSVYDYGVRYLDVKDTFEDYWNDLISGKYNSIYINNLIKNPILVTNRDINPKILDMLNALSREHTIYYVTARPDELNFATKQWFKRNKLPQQENLYITNNGDKVKYIVDHKIDVFVEDREKNAIELKDYTKVILVKQLWNESIRDQFLCVNTVLELPEVLESLKVLKVV
jgi:uncharacterized HAD superfamily protein